jgi:hypothetical protein
MSPLFSETDTTDPILVAFETERQKGKSYDECLEAAINAHVERRAVTRRTLRRVQRSRELLLPV